MPKYKFPTFEEVERAIAEDDYQGWCIVCGDWTHDSCEPDAHRYECPECERSTVFGAEELVICGLIRESNKGDISNG